MYRDAQDQRRSGPALLSAIRDTSGSVTGVHRTWIDISENPPVMLFRKIMGRAREHAVHLGGEGQAALVGEGIETVWSLREITDDVRLFAALSAAKLALWRWPSNVTSLFIAIDNDENGAGEDAARRLMDRSEAASLPAVPLFPRLGDFNDDLKIDGPRAVRALISRQILQSS